MAELTTHAPTPVQRPLHLQLLDLECEIDEVHDIISAHEAVEQLMRRADPNSQETLAEVDRDSLAQLLSVLNVALRQRTKFALMSIARVREAGQ